MNGCREDPSLQYEYDSSIPEKIQDSFLSQYSKGLTSYRWQKSSEYYMVYFEDNHLNKIAFYNDSARLVQMETQVLMTEELENKMNMEITNKGGDYKIESCFWVVKQDSIYYKIYYRNFNEPQIACLPGTKIPTPVYE